MQKTIEQKTESTILQKTEAISVGRHVYYIAPPSTATLIMASAAISKLPSRKLDITNIVNETLATAQDCEAIGEIAAIFILGAKGANPIYPGFLHIRQKLARRRTERLAKRLLQELTPSEMNNLLAEVLKRLEVADFFGLTTFLTEINLLRATKVVTETTASGQ